MADLSSLTDTFSVSLAPYKRRRIWSGVHVWRLTLPPGSYFSNCAVQQRVCLWRSCNALWATEQVANPKYGSNAYLPQSEAIILNSSATPNQSVEQKTGGIIQVIFEEWDNHLFTPDISMLAYLALVSFELPRAHLDLSLH